MTYETPSRDWALSFALTNAADEFYMLNNFDLRAFDIGTASGQPGRPQEWAVTFRHNFGEWAGRRPRRAAEDYARLPRLERAEIGDGEPAFPLLAPGTATRSSRRRGSGRAYCRSALRLFDLRISA